MIEINNLTNFAVDKKFFIGLAKKVLKGENRERENLSIVFVGASKIQKLNKKYRKKNKPTDVLSFEKNPDFIKDVNEVVICPALIKKNALNYINNIIARSVGTNKSSLSFVPPSLCNYKIVFKEELTKVLIHGILHILGYDHERSKKDAKGMEIKQEYYFLKIQNSKS